MTLIPVPSGGDNHMLNHMGTLTRQSIEKAPLGLGSVERAKQRGLSLN